MTLTFGSACSGIEAASVAFTPLGWRAAVDCPDDPRYRALGNSWAVPCVAWIGARLYAHLYRLNSAIDATVNSDHTVGVV